MELHILSVGYYLPRANLYSVIVVGVDKQGLEVLNSYAYQSLLFFERRRFLTIAKRKNTQLRSAFSLLWTMLSG
jgi:hypothetical protein